MRTIFEKRIMQEEACESMEEIVERYKDMVYRIIILRVRNSWDADDVFQEVFLTYCRKQPVFWEEEHRKAWLIRTTMNLVKKAIGSTWKQRVDVVESVDDIPGEFEFQEKEETQTFVAIRKLPEKYQIVLTLFYFDEMSTREIAETLSIREGTVRMRLNRAREKMREMLESGGKD